MDERRLRQRADDDMRTGTAKHAVGDRMAIRRIARRERSVVAGSATQFEAQRAIAGGVGDRREPGETGKKTLNDEEIADRDGDERSPQFRCRLSRPISHGRASYGNGR